MSGLSLAQEREVENWWSCTCCRKVDRCLVSDLIERVVTKAFSVRRCVLGAAGGSEMREMDSAPGGHCFTEEADKKAGQGVVKSEIPHPERLGRELRRELPYL